MYNSPAFPTRPTSSSIGISRSTSRARARFAHVALNESAVGAAHRRDRLAGREVHDLVDVDARVGLTPAENGNVKHVGNGPN